MSSSATTTPPGGAGPGAPSLRPPAAAPPVAPLLAAALPRVDAPDVVFAVTRRGERTVVAGGTGPEPAVPREELRYELGSASKTFAALLLAQGVAEGRLALSDLLFTRLPPLPVRHPAAYRITLGHLATHTSGLPRLPLGLLPGAVVRPRVNTYPRYDTDGLLRAFAHTRPRYEPGTRWRYSNFAVSLLGHALAHTARTGYAALLADRVLRPLGLAGVALEPGTPDTDATGHRVDGRTPVPGVRMGGFAPAGAVRGTPHALLGYLEALLEPDATALGPALRAVARPVLRRGRRHRHTHTLGWFHHPAPGGPMLFHAGATFGQQAFLGFHPTTRTGVVALATRRGNSAGLVETGYELLHTLAGGPAVPTLP